MCQIVLEMLIYLILASIFTVILNITIQNIIIFTVYTNRIPVSKWSILTPKSKHYVRYFFRYVNLSDFGSYLGSHFEYCQSKCHPFYNYLYLQYPLLKLKHFGIKSIASCWLVLEICRFIWFLHPSWQSSWQPSWILSCKMSSFQQYFLFT